MSDHLILPQRVLDVYRCLKGAAEHGDECPSNGFLATVGGYGQANAASNAVATLEALGLIEVVRYGRARVVRILETGKSTRAVQGAAIRYLPNRKRKAA